MAKKVKEFEPYKGEKDLYQKQCLNEKRQLIFARRLALVIALILVGVSVACIVSGGIGGIVGAVVFFITAMCYYSCNKNTGALAFIMTGVDAFVCLYGALNNVNEPNWRTAFFIAAIALSVILLALSLKLPSLSLYLKGDYKERIKRAE